MYEIIRSLGNWPSEIEALDTATGGEHDFHGLLAPRTSCVSKDSHLLFRRAKSLPILTAVC